MRQFMYYVANSCGTSCDDVAFKAFRHYHILTILTNKMHYIKYI